MAALHYYSDSDQKWCRKQLLIIIVYTVAQISVKRLLSGSRTDRNNVCGCGFDCHFSQIWVSPHEHVSIKHFKAPISRLTEQHSTWLWVSRMHAVLTISTAVNGSSVLPVPDTLSSYPPLHCGYTAWTAELQMEGKTTVSVEIIFHSAKMFVFSCCKNENVPRHYSNIFWRTWTNFLLVRNYQLRLQYYTYYLLLTTKTEHQPVLKHIYMTLLI